MYRVKVLPRNCIRDYTTDFTHKKKEKNVTRARFRTGQRGRLTRKRARRLHSNEFPVFFKKLLMRAHTHTHTVGKSHACL